MIKTWVKNTPQALRLYRWGQWRAHLFKDWYGTVLWKRKRWVDIHGFRLLIGFHPAYDQMEQGAFEPTETEFFLSHISQFDLFIDVGTNIGYFTGIALSKGVHTICIEPQAQNLTCLYQTLRKNKWAAEVFPVAASNTTGLLSLFGASGPSASLVQGWAEYSDSYTQTVPVHRLDDLLAHRCSGRVLVKVDVEGAEYQALEGAVVIIQNPGASFLVEVCFDEFHPEGANPDFQKTFDLFWREGYSAIALGGSPSIVSPADVAGWLSGSGRPQGHNYLFTRTPSDFYTL